MFPTLWRSTPPLPPVSPSAPNLQALTPSPEGKRKEKTPEEELQDLRTENEDLKKNLAQVMEENNHLNRIMGVFAQNSQFQNEYQVKLKKAASDAHKHDKYCSRQLSTVAEYLCPPENAETQKIDVATVEGILAGNQLTISNITVDEEPEKTNREYVNKLRKLVVELADFENDTQIHLGHALSRTGILEQLKPLAKLHKYHIKIYEAKNSLDNPSTNHTNLEKEFNTDLSAKRKTFVPSKEKNTIQFTASHLSNDIGLQEQEWLTMETYHLYSEQVAQRIKEKLKADREADVRVLTRLRNWTTRTWNSTERTYLLLKDKIPLLIWTAAFYTELQELQSQIDKLFDEVVRARKVFKGRVPEDTSSTRVLEILTEKYQGKKEAMEEDKKNSHSGRFLTLLTKHNELKKRMDAKLNAIDAKIAEHGAYKVDETDDFKENFITNECESKEKIDSDLKEHHDEMKGWFTGEKTKLNRSWTQLLQKFEKTAFELDWTNNAIATEGSFPKRFLYKAYKLGPNRTAWRDAGNPVQEAIFEQMKKEPEADELVDEVTYDDVAVSINNRGGSHPGGKGSAQKPLKQEKKS